MFTPFSGEQKVTPQALKFSFISTKTNSKCTSLKLSDLAWNTLYLSKKTLKIGWEMRSEISF